MSDNVTIVIDESWFAWVRDESHEDGGTTLGYKSTLVAAVRQADDLGLNPTHWMRVGGREHIIPTGIVRNQPKDKS